MRTAAIVPRGIDRAGFFRSPDIPTPERIPVTAGKNTANTGHSPSEGGTSAGATGASEAGGDPIKNETSEKAIAPMMKYWDFKAISADSDETAARSVSVAKPT